MAPDTLRTSADDLYELVKSEKKISIEEAAKRLHLPLQVVHSLVDFLVEEKIFGIEYKFTTPFVYISTEKNALNRQGTQDPLPISKEQFFERAKARNIPLEKVSVLWNKYLAENTQRIRAQFYESSARKGLPIEQINSLWERYLGYLR